MRPFMYEESDWVLVNDDLHKETQGPRSCRYSVHLERTCVRTCRRESKCSYFEDKVWRRARSNCGSEDPIMVRVDQCLVQVQN